MELPRTDGSGVTVSEHHWPADDDAPPDDWPPKVVDDHFRQIAAASRVGRLEVRCGAPCSTAMGWTRYRNRPR